MKWKSPLLLMLFLLSFAEVKAQKLAVKTNVLWDALSTINVGAEYGIAPRWTIDISGNYNGWKRTHGRRWKHWFVQPEARYWFCEKFSGHFLGFHAHGGKFNLSNIGSSDIKFFGTDFGKLQGNRYQGWFAGAGVGYGYAWILSKHWNVEAEIGIGYSYTRYDHYPCADCGSIIESDKVHHYFGPTKVALNLVYVF